MTVAKENLDYNDRRYPQKRPIASYLYTVKAQLHVRGALLQLLSTLLQYVAVCCSVVALLLQGCCSVVAECCRVLQSVLQRIIVHYSVLQFVAVCCSMLQYVAVCCSMLQYGAACCVLAVAVRCRSKYMNTVSDIHTLTAANVTGKPTRQS